MGDTEILGLCYICARGLKNGWVTFDEVPEFLKDETKNAYVDLFGIDEDYNRLFGVDIHE